MQQTFPYVFVKYPAGQAYYITLRSIYYRSQTSDYILLIHLLSGNRYEVHRWKVEEVRWTDLPYNYQLDAMALNQEIREFVLMKKEQGEKDYPHLNKDTMDLNKSLLSEADKAFRELDMLVDRYEFKYRKDNPPKVHPSSNPEGYKAKPNVDFAPKGVYVASPGSWEDAHRRALAAQEDIAAFYSGLVDPPKGANQQTNKQTNIMNIPGLNLEFGKVSDRKLGLTFSGDVAFRNKNGQYVTVGKDEEGVLTATEVGDMKFDMDFFMVPVSSEDLEVGDLVLLEGEYLIVGERKNGTQAFINPLTGSFTNKLPRTNLLGMYFYTKIVNMFDLIDGDLSDNPLALLALSSGTDAGKPGAVSGGALGGIDLGQMLLFSTLGKKKGEKGGLNPLMLMALQGQEGTQGSGLGNLLLMSHLAGDKPGKGLSGLFGKKVKGAPKFAEAAEAQQDDKALITELLAETRALREQNVRMAESIKAMQDKQNNPPIV